MPNVFTVFFPYPGLSNVIQKTDPEHLLHLVNQSNVDWTDLDMNTVGSGYIPTEAHTVIIFVRFLDTGAASPNYGCSFRKLGETDPQQQQDLCHLCQGNWSTSLMQIGLNLDGRLQYRILASGTNTATIEVCLAGWIEPA